MNMADLPNDIVGLLALAIVSVVAVIMRVGQTRHQRVLNDVHSEVSNNHRSNLRDDIDSITGTAKDIQGRMDLHESGQNAMQHQIDAMAQEVKHLWSAINNEIDRSSKSDDHLKTMILAFNSGNGKGDVQPRN